MYVKLTSYTTPCIELLQQGVVPEGLIAYCARVSNPDNQHNVETQAKLLRFLIKNKHWSPFEMVNMCVEIQTSRAIAQQILRHRSFSFQEFSQRYAEATTIEPVEMRLQAEKNRQSSTAVFVDATVQAILDTVEDQAISNYQALLEKGVAKECARFVLPLSTQTTLYMNGTVRSWIHYLEQRCDEHTQKEHREIAMQIRDILKQIYPVVYKAVFENA